MAGAAVDGSLTDDINLARQLEEMRAANQRLQRANSRLKEKQADLVEAVYRASKDAAVMTGRPGTIPRPARDRRRSPEVALLHLTDWQLGKKTDSYDTEVCKQRVGLAVAKTVKLTEIQRADHPVRDIHVMLGGDLVENVTIFPGQAYEVDSNAFTQVFEAAALVEQVVLSLLGAFESVTVHEVAGNHGRLGRKGDAPREDNLDRIVYRIVRERLADPRLTWEPGEGFYRIVEIGEYRAMLVHGDQIKSFGGNVPAYGVLRKANAWAAGGIPDTFSDVYLGHMHQPMTLQMSGGGLVRMTPSTESGSAYAREFMASHGRPGQRLAFVDPKRGRVTADYLLWLDDE
jgi:hypothetical protein